MAATLQNAIDMYEKSIPFYKHFGHFGDKADLYITLGEMHFITGNYPKALAMYEQAFQVYQKLGKSGSYTIHKKARILDKMGEKNKALLLFEEAIEKVEKTRRQTGITWMKEALMENVYHLYRETVVFMLQNKYHQGAFKYIEYMKARVFLDRLTEGINKTGKRYLAPITGEKR